MPDLRYGSRALAACGDGAREEEGLDSRADARPQAVSFVRHGDLGALSPEVVLVLPPELAQQARELLPDRSEQPEVEAPEPELAIELEPEPEPEPVALPERLTEAGVARTEPVRPRRRLVRLGIVLTVALLALVTAAAGFVGGRKWRGTLPGPEWVPGHAVAAPQPAAVPVASPARSRTGSRQHRSTTETTTTTTAPRPATTAAPPAKKPAAHPPKPSPPPATTTTTAPPPPAAAKKPAEQPRKPTAKRPSAPPVRKLPVDPSPPAPTKTAPPPPPPPARSASSDGHGAAGFVPSRRFAWAPMASAQGYLLRIFRDGQKVYEAWCDDPSMTLPAKFRFATGSYRWEVLPAHGKPPSAQYGPAIVNSTFVVTPAAARAAG
jgi:hypothetical protein